MLLKYYQKKEEFEYLYKKHFLVLVMEVFDKFGVIRNLIAYDGK